MDVCHSCVLAVFLVSKRAPSCCERPCLLSEPFSRFKNKTADEQKKKQTIKDLVLLKGLIVLRCCWVHELLLSSAAVATVC